MPKLVEINVHHITRVEGHGNIAIRATDGKIDKVEWQVPEAPRFFEAMVRGRRWEDIQSIVSRICGICSVAHSLAAIKAIEDAMDVVVSPQTEKLRILALYGEFIESHVLHIGYLVAPDLLGVKSVVPLVDSHPDLVKLVVRLHRLGNTMMEVLAGRRTHPLTFCPGGFKRLPKHDELSALRDATRRRVARPAGTGGCRLWREGEAARLRARHRICRPRRPRHLHLLPRQHRQLRHHQHRGGAEIQTGRQ